MGRKELPLVERLNRNSRRDGSCTLWTGKARNGYGVLRVRGRWVRAHRAAYELFVKDIPKGMVIDHLCRVTRCIAPWHLQAVTIQENTARGASKAAVAIRTGFCWRGHKLPPPKIVNGNRYRRCRPCQRVYDRKYRQRFKVST